MSADLGEQIAELVPKLRAFAISLCSNATMGDDLVQETVVKAWAARDRFEPGTNLNAWLHTILRNTYFSQLRKTKRMVEDPDGSYEATLVVPAEQEGRIEHRDLRRALAELSADQREAIVLVCAGGFSYEEAASIAGCAVGTVKSRVNRGREMLVTLMGREVDLDKNAADAA